MSIADVSNAVLETLRRQMPPLINPEQIGFHTPGDSDGGVLLGLFIYHTAKDMRYQMNSPISIDSHVSQRPPVCMEAFYMVTPYIGKKSDFIDDYKLLDRVLQIWHDNGAIPYTSALQPQYVPPPRVELLSYEPDIISKIWPFPGVPYRPSLFYKAAPIAIASTIQSTSPRVRESSLNADETTPQSERR